MTSNKRINEISDEDGTTMSVRYDEVELVERSSSPT